MLFGIGVFLFIIAYILKSYYKSWLNPGSMFSFLWGTIFILYSFKLFEIYSASINTLVIFTIGIISFLCGCIPVSFTLGKRNLHIDYVPECWSFSFDVKTRIFFMLLSIFAMSILFIRAISILPYWVGGVSLVKQANAEGFITYSTWINILYTFFASPFVTLSVFVVAVDFFFERGAYSRIQLFVTVCMLIFGYIGSGSKFSLFVPMMTFAIVYHFYIKERRQDITQRIHLSLGKKILIGIAIIGIGSFLIFMLNKKYGGWVESLYMYLTGCVPCGDNALMSMLDDGHYFGMVSLNGIFRVISQIFAFIGIKLPYSSYMNEAYDAMLVYEKAIYISPTVRYNAFISVFSYFYKDGGIIGVAIGSLVFGRISHLSYRRLIAEKSAYSLLLYLYICYLILFSIVRMQLYLAPVVMVWIYLQIFFKRRN